MAVEDAAEGWLGSDMLLGPMWDSLITTSAEKQAKEARAKAAQQAQDQLDFTKAVYGENKDTINDLQAELFGQSPEAIAQAYADERAAGFPNSPGSSYSGQTRSGRQGSFDFGQGAGAPTASGASAPTAPTAPAPTEYTWDANGNMVPIQGPYNDISRPQPAAPTAAPVSAPGKAAITADDRARAAKAAQAGYGKTLPGQLDSARSGYGSAVDKLIADLQGINRVDPGQYSSDWNTDANRQYVSPEARAAQKQAMDKTFALTDTKETAEEKLMREVARRSMEQDLRGQREAQASQLRTRGAYGSGAELAGFLGAQQELAQRRSLEEMGANANAQKRAIAALGQYGNQAFQLGGQDLQQGSLQDMNDRFNKGQQVDFKKFQTRTQQEENEAASKRNATEADAKIGLANKTGDDAKWIADMKTRVAGAKTGTNLASAAPIASARSGLADSYKTKALELDADDAAKKWGIF